MASGFFHAIVALAMGKAFEDKDLSWRELLLGAICSVVPDLDVIGFPLVFSTVMCEAIVG